MECNAWRNSKNMMTSEHCRRITITIINSNILMDGKWTVGETQRWTPRNSVKWKQTDFTIINILRWFHCYFMAHSYKNPNHSCTCLWVCVALLIFTANDQINKRDSTFSALLCGSLEICTRHAVEIFNSVFTHCTRVLHRMAVFECYHSVFNDKLTTTVVSRAAWNLSNKLGRWFFAYRLRNI